VALTLRHFSPETPLGFFSWEHNHGASVDLAQTLLDLIEPSPFDTFVYLLVEAFE